MKKTQVSIPSLIILLCIAVDNANATYYNSRISVWGLAGQQDQARGDFLFPLFGNQNNLTYIDLQGSYTRANNADNANYAGIGAGFRKQYTSSVYGAYLFFDRDETQLHSVFNVLSPGVEAFFQDWDFRINGYFTVSRHSKTVSFFPSQQGCGDCGINSTNNQFVVFTGHQQFERRFSVLEKSGLGVDTEVGYTFHRLLNTQLHAGVYYFNFNNSNSFSNLHNTNNITGIEGRLEVPVNPKWAVTVESSYDNYQHGTIMGGLRFNFFAPSETKSYDINSHMVDPIPRNLGSLKTGSGIPAVKATKNDGLYLTRDNIYFFTSEGGSAFVDTVHSGTFENPLKNDQFSQPVVNAIGNNGNFYFNSGSYLIMGAGATPNAQINLLMGDSIYGRNLGYQSSATGGDRPILLGRINLLQGNNTIDSMQLINSGIHAGNTHLNLIALSIQNASNIFLCNDNINTIATTNGDLQAGFSNTATGINANNSQVLIENSSISANAVVNGTIIQAGGILGSNFAVGIGGNSTPATSANFIGNSFTILNSTVNGSVSAVADNGDNFAMGIGNAAGNNGGSANFSENYFLISNSIISSNATANSIGFSTGDNTAIGIGNSRHFGSADFTNNIFRIQTSQISSTAFTSGDNAGVNTSLGIGSWGNMDFIGNNFSLSNTTINSTSVVSGNNNFPGINEALGIGNVEFGNSFSNNIFNLTNSNVNSTALVNGSNPGFQNLAMGIGNVSGTTFENNTFNLVGSVINANASVGGDNDSTFNGNEAIGIGGFADISFANNTFNLTNSNVNATSLVNGNNNFFNITIGAGDLLGHFTGNTFNFTNSSVNADATVNSNNSVSNIAIGMGVGPFTSGFTNNRFNIANSTINSTASVNGNNSGSNLAFGVDLDNGGNTATIDQSIIDTLAKVNGTNNGSNSATGVATTGVGDEITINNSVVNTTASASGPGTNIATGHAGNVISSNTTYNTQP